MPVTSLPLSVLVLGALVSLAGCGDPHSVDQRTAASEEESSSVSHGSRAVADGGSTAPPATGAEDMADDGFVSSIEEVPEHVRARMDGGSMRPGCPVGYDDLRYVRVSHIDDTGASVVGELVVAADVAEDVVEVFRELHRAAFPIASMRLVDDFGRSGDPDGGADDFASIEADNTSAFNCRLRTGSTTEFSEHSLGTAIDINPLRNPYVSKGGTTSHPRSVPYLDRSNVRPGMIVDGDPVVSAFARIGWSWGGHWDPPVDHQHFSAGGR